MSPINEEDSANEGAKNALTVVDHFKNLIAPDAEHDRNTGARYKRIFTAKDPLRSIL